MKKKLLKLLIILIIQLKLFAKDLNNDKSISEEEINNNKSITNKSENEEDMINDDSGETEDIENIKPNFSKKSKLEKKLNGPIDMDKDIDIKGSLGKKYKVNNFRNDKRTGKK